MPWPLLSARHYAPSGTGAEAAGAASGAAAGAAAAGTGDCGTGPDINPHTEACRLQPNPGGGGSETPPTGTSPGGDIRITHPGGAWLWACRSNGVPQMGSPKSPAHHARFQSSPGIPSGSAASSPDQLAIQKFCAQDQLLLILWHSKQVQLCQLVSPPKARCSSIMSYDARHYTASHHACSGEKGLQKVYSSSSGW